MLGRQAQQQVSEIGGGFSVRQDVKADDTNAMDLKKLMEGVEVCSRRTGTTSTRTSRRTSRCGSRPPVAEPASGKIRPLTRLDSRKRAYGRRPKHMADRKPIESWLTDMDGVLIHEGVPIPGADAFLKKLRESGLPFLVLTNNSIYTQRDLHARLQRMGLDVPMENIWTSALATAQFLDDQRPGGSAYVIGEAGLTTALHDIGYVLTDHDPDFVILGETRTYSFEAMTKAVRLINDGARFIATNPDNVGPSAEGALPATGSVAALITAATGRKPYFIGKPNPLMMRAGLNAIGAHSETSAMIGDRMDTDVLAGLEAGMRTFLVLTGVTQAKDIDRYPFRPSHVVDSIADLVERI